VPSLSHRFLKSIEAKPILFEVEAAANWRRGRAIEK
jgi:hypothetical protein